MSNFESQARKEWEAFQKKYKEGKPNSQTREQLRAWVQHLQTKRIVSQQGNIQLRLAIILTTARPGARQSTDYKRAQNNIKMIEAAIKARVEMLNLDPES